MKKYSIGSWAYLFKQDQPTNDFHALVHKLMHLGYAGIELGAFAPHPTPESHDTKEKRQKLRKMVLDHRLDFSGLAANIWEQPIWKEDDHTVFLASFQKYAIFAEDLGIPRIRVDTVGPMVAVRDSGVEPKRLLDRCVKAFDACAKTAAQHGLTVCWEFEPCFPVQTPSEIVALVDGVRALGNANFGVLFDSANAHVCTEGKSVELAQQLRGKIVHLQLSDADGTLNENGGATHVPLGQGKINFDQLMPELLNSGVPNDWWCVDIAYWPDAWAVTSESKRLLDKMRHKFSA